MKKQTTCLLVLGLSFMACSDSTAQTAVRRIQAVQIKPGEIPAEVLTNFPAGAKVVSGTNSAAKPAEQSPEEKRLQELLKLQFDRRAPAVLQALAKQTENAANTNVVEKYKTDVVAGNWPAVKEFLAKLPEKHRPQVYKHLLTELQKKSPGGQQNIPDPESGVVYYQGGNQQQNQPGPVLLPDDVLALADAAPVELTEELAEQLGKLLGMALSKGSVIEPFLEKLEAGAGGLGGKDPKKRELAANVLIAANRLADAGNFLPELQPALDKKEIKSIDLHARYLLAIGKQPKETNNVALQKAWDLTQTILSVTNSSAKDKEQALTRSLDMMPLLSKKLGSDWLRQQFQNQAQQGMGIIASVGSLVSQSGANRDLETRRKNLDLQRRVVEALLAAVGKDTKAWETALNLLALGWVQEAENSKTKFIQKRSRMYPTYDNYGNMYYEDPYRYDYNNQTPFVPLDQILQTAPGESWITLLDKSLAPRVHSLIADAYMRLEVQEQKALPYIELIAKEQPKVALGLANDLLQCWAKNHDPNQPNDPNQMGGRRIYYGPYGQQIQPPGTSLTRAMQVRNIQELSTILNRLRQLPIGQLDEKAVVAAFTSSHSVAEVFRVEDIETVFGSVPDIRPELLAELLQAMRQRLAGQWRAPKVQKDAKTNRSDKEIEGEVTRGYEMVTRLIGLGMEKKSDDWRMNLVQGAALFDWAEFDYGKKVDLAIYTEKRDRAFKSFERAAQLYADKVPSLEDKDYSILPFFQWFNATLGASDLAYLTRQTEPNPNHLEKIKSALLALPGEASERHIGMFGKSVNDGIQSLKPELKPRYLRSAIQIVGAHESAVEARKLAMYYDDLLQEIVLDVRVDGDTAVGHGNPFGVFVSIRHTEALGRESGGFSKYLRNQNQGYNYYNPYGAQPQNYRDDFEKQVRDKFTETFEILSVTFHEDKVEPRGYGRVGWRETPYAYLLLKAKDGAVDRIPSLQLDMDFVDKKGQVVLPIISQVQVIDARPASVASRPVENVEILQILDQRDLAKGQLALEIKATGHGLLPELKELLDISLAGFKVDKMDDKGVAIAKMETEGVNVAPVSERNCLVTLSVDASKRIPPAFHFPKSKLQDAKMVYKHYADADLEEVKPEVALAGVQLRPRRLWMGLVAGSVGLIVAGWFVFRKKKTALPMEQAPVYTIPGHVTPFTVLNLLQRMHNDHALSLTAEQRRELSESIGNLQQRYFSKTNELDGSAELKKLAEQWVGRSGGRGTSVN